ncbi:unnamed protein product [Acanthoscelides obtectus]|uniref:PiggyBac transposable element-derived protein domain-containing protein n=1 Tax=Acanthoscelides obtectus TaxID=200917 RepID=A0A9P0KX97_ACAOB|nr:unnamed protein product [Acanthoscelides obtectus]CAK1641952.1 hypothetical protein AOBTE_LOCUS12751 [Acanthoscelides obtectus]
MTKSALAPAWLDNTPVCLASYFCAVEPEGVCKKWSKAEDRHIEIKHPAIVKEYNGVIGKFSMRKRTKNWTVRTIFNFIAFAVAAGWLEYRQDANSTGLAKKNTIDYLDFKLSIAKTLVLKTEELDEMEDE